MKKLLLVGLIILVFVLGQKFLEPDNETAIKQRIADLQTALILNRTENKLEALAKAKEIASFFSPNFTAEGPEEIRTTNFKDRKEFQNKITATRTQATKMEVKLGVEDIKIEDDSAILEVKIAILGAFDNIHGEFFDLHLVELLMDKSSGDWLISGASHLENLRGDPNPQPIEEY